MRFIRPTPDMRFSQTRS